MKAKERKKFHITIVNNEDKTVEIDTDFDSVAGVLQKEDNLINRFAYADVDAEGIKQLIIGLVREAAYISERL